MSRILASYADQAERDGLQVKVTSSNLDSVWYQADFERLFVWFGGKLDKPLITRYAYSDVSPEQYAGLLAAQSKGSYLSRTFKNGPHAYSGPF